MVLWMRGFGCLWKLVRGWSFGAEMVLALCILLRRLGFGIVRRCLRMSRCLGRSGRLWSRVAISMVTIG